MPLQYIKVGHNGYQPLASQTQQLSFTTLIFETSLNMASTNLYSLTTSAKKETKKVKIFTLGPTKTCIDRGQQKYRRYAVAVMENQWIKIEILSEFKRLEPRKVYSVNNYLTEGVHLRFHARTTLMRTFPNSSVDTPQTAQPELPTSLCRNIAFEDQEDRTKRRFSANGTVATVNIINFPSYYVLCRTDLN